MQTFEKYNVSPHKTRHIRGRGSRIGVVDFERRNLTLPETKNGKRHEIWLRDFALCQLKSLH